MAYEFDQISIARHFNEMDEIIEDYYARDRRCKQGMMPDIDMNWARMCDVERSGGIIAVGAFDGDQLVGFAIYIVGPHQHHQGTIMATCDTLAVDLDHRGHGLGKQLVREAEVLLRERSVRLMAHGHRVCYEREPIFPGLGFVLEELIYVKEL